MRVLYLAPVDLSRGGGPAVHVRRVSAAMEVRGHAVRLLAHLPAPADRWEGPAGGLVLAGGPARYRLPRLRHLASEWALARALRRELERFRPDLLLVRQEPLTISPWLARVVARPRQVPLVVESNSSLPGMAASAGCSRGRVAQLAAWEGRLLRAADAVGVVGAALARRHAEEHGVAADRLFVVPNGAWIPPPPGTEATARRRARGVGDGEFLVAFAGNLNALQGLDLLLDVLSRADLPGVHAWIIGDASGRPEWEDRARRLGASVQFLGALSEEETAVHLQAAQVVVAPYRAAAWERAAGSLCSLKVLTALACDRPLLLSDAPGFEPLRDVPSVTLIATHDAKTWAAVLRRRRAEWERAGRPALAWPWPEGEGPGRRFIEAGHTWAHTAAAWEAAFARATSGSEPPPR